MKKNIYDVLIILFGSLICSFAYNSFLMPNELLAGGLSGISLMMDYYFNFPVYWGLIILNIPILIVGFLYLDKKKIFYTIGYIVLSAFFIPLLKNFFPIFQIDMILSSIFGGLINGFGNGLILRCGGTTGGTDVLGNILKNKKNISIGTFSFAFNIILLIIYSFFTPLNTVLYTTISMFIGSKIVDLIIVGIVKNKMVTIISTKPQEITEKILTTLHRGVTVFEGEGGYTNNHERILQCVITHYQVPALKELVYSIDPKSFMYVSETIEVQGKGFYKKSFIQKDLP